MRRRHKLVLVAVATLAVGVMSASIASSGHWEVITYDALNGPARLLPANGAYLFDNEGSLRDWLEAYGKITSRTDRSVIYTGSVDFAKARVAVVVAPWAPWKVKTLKTSHGTAFITLTAKRGRPYSSLEVLDGAELRRVVILRIPKTSAAKADANWE